MNEATLTNTSFTRIFFNGWLKQICVALAYCALGLATNLYFNPTGTLSIFWPGSGFALATILIGGRRYLGGLFLGMLVLGALSNTSFFWTLTDTCSNIIEVALGGWLLTRDGKFRPSLSSMSDYLRLLVVGGGVANAAGSVLNALPFLLSGDSPVANFLEHSKLYWMEDALGVALVTPLILFWWQNSTERIHGRQLVEPLLIFSLSFIAGQIVFLGWLNEYLSYPPKDYWMFLYVCGVAIKMGTRGVTLVVLMVAMQAIVGAHLHVGFFSHEIERSGLQNYWAYMLVLSLVGMTIATYVSNIKQVSNSLGIAATAFEVQEGIIVTDARGKIIRVNNSFSKITGYTPEEIIGRNPSILNSGRQDASFYEAMWKSINTYGVWSGEIWNRRKSYEIYSEYLTVTAVKDSSGTVTNYVGAFADITKAKEAEEAINELVFFDPLTKLSNRRLLQDRLFQAMSSSDRSGQVGALLFIDLDNFKTINDTLGHARGDQLLQQVAIRLKSCVRLGDTVARLGGDEFVVLLEDLGEQAVHAAAQAEVIGEKILATLNQPYQLGSRDLINTPSIGVSLFNGHQQLSTELFKQADIAMYQAKNEGRNTLRFFDPKVQLAINKRVTLESELRSAIVCHQFFLYYQIQVDHSKRIFGAEALIRWVHPTRNLVSPAEFIPIAEETGLILPIGKWVLDTACAQLSAWQLNETTRDLILSVNVSAKQFRQADFAAQVKEIIQRHGINPTRLKLELTESILLDNMERIISTMNEISTIGVRFALDDFGTGYSSLQYLKKLPLYQLKIDQSFVKDLIVDTSDNAIVNTIIAIAHSLNLEVIAEGVETEEQRQYLEKAGCTQYQGYLFGKPVPIKEFKV